MCPDESAVEWTLFFFGTRLADVVVRTVLWKEPAVGVIDSQDHEKRAQPMQSTDSFLA